MTKKLFIIAGISFVAFIALFIAGFASAAAAPIFAAMFCAMPLFFMALGAALGSFATNYEITPKRANTPVRQKLISPVQKEVLG